MEKFGTIDSREKTIAIVGDRWWQQKAKQQGGTISKKFLCNIYGKNVMSARMLEVSLLGVGTVLRLERDAWSMVKWLRQATNEYPHHRKWGVISRIFGKYILPWMRNFYFFHRSGYKLAKTKYTIAPPPKKCISYKICYSTTSSIHIER